MNVFRKMSEIVFKENELNAIQNFVESFSEVKLTLN